MFTRISLFVMAMALTLSAVAQQSGCATMDLPVNVIKKSGEPVTGLSAADFSVQLKKQAAHIDSATYGGGPRRILFVIDTSKKLSADARRLEMVFAQAIMSASQPEDSFALITARGISQTVKFGAGRSDLTKALQVLNEGAGEVGDNHAGPLDAVTDGVSWFGEPHVGDTIVLMALNLEDNHKANPTSVAKLLGDHGIRLFGLALGPLQLQNPTAATMQLDNNGFGYRQPGMQLHENLADANFFPLSRESGGYIVPENTIASHSEFELTEAKKVQMQSNGHLMARLIDNFYDIHIKASSGSHAEAANVSLDKEHAAAGLYVLFPHNAGACSSTVASK